MIPNRFHFVFGLKQQTEPFHLMHYLCLASCFDVHKPDAVYFYYQHEPYGRYWDLMKERIIPIQIPGVPFVEQYHYTDRRVAQYKYAHASDFVRLEKLLATGGIYADMDTLFVNPLPAALYEKSFVLGREDDVYDAASKQLRPSVCNAFMMAERNAPFGKLWLERLPGAFDGTWSHHSTILPWTLATEHPDMVHLEPPRTFYKYMWSREGLHTLLEGLDTDNEGVGSFHLWAHLWWSRWRRDFSSFYGAKITPEFVRAVDTTYNVIARQFLPPPETRSFVVRHVAAAQQKIAPVQRAAYGIGMRAYVLTKLAAFSILNDKVFPNTTHHLDYARRQRRHPYIYDRFQARTRFELVGIFDDVALWDTYEVEHRTFASDDVILDIGAHTGMFSYMCYIRGSRAVYAYEPETKNFRQLARHLGGLSGITLQNLAVVRSDEPASYALVHSGPQGDNTGGGNVLMQGQLLDVSTQLFDRQLSAPHTVQTIALDEILEQVGRVKFLKIDCEGSEFPILLTCRLLERVEHIAGEFHEIDPHVYAALDPHTRLADYNAYHMQDIVQCLEQSGFRVKTTRTAPHLGKFTAWRQGKST